MTWEERTSICICSSPPDCSFAVSDCDRVRPPTLLHHHRKSLAPKKKYTYRKLQNHSRIIIATPSSYTLTATFSRTSAQSIHAWQLGDKASKDTFRIVIRRTLDVLAFKVAIQVSCFLSSCIILMLRPRMNRITTGRFYRWYPSADPHSWRGVRRNRFRCWSKQMKT